MTNPAPAYFEGSRPEVASLVPVSCRSILDVGCGFGGLGSQLRSRGFNDLYGIEINPDATSKLEGIYAQHWICDVEKLALPSPGDVFVACLTFGLTADALRAAARATEQVGGGRFQSILGQGATMWIRLAAILVKAIDDLRRALSTT